MVRAGGCVQGHYVRDQKVRAQSSGEAEFYGIGSIANELVGLKGVWEDLGFKLDVYIESDATAGIGMCLRRGTGKVRHLDLRHPVVQDYLRSG